MDRQTKDKAASTLLGRALGRKVDYAALPRTPYGKPYLEGGPHFSLSHSGRFAALAVSDQTPVGLDLQQVTDLPWEKLLRIAKQQFAKDLAKHLERVGEPEGRLLFFRLWSMYEAYGKLLGRGMAAVKKAPADWAAKTIGEAVFRELPPPAEGYALCVCAPAALPADLRLLLCDMEEGI